jgi:hypothetical protein
MYNHQINQLINKKMKKLVLLSLLAIGMIGSSVAQFAIPGAAFADNPSRFNGRKVTLKDIKVNFTDLVVTPVSAVAPAPLAGPVQMPTVAPGPNGTGNVAVRCNPPRGFSQVNVDFNAAPNYKGCFFMADQMYNELKRQTGGQSVDAQITFRGDARTGYNVSFYKLGK